MDRKRPLQDLFRIGGRRLTRQRRLVLQILEESQEHLDAESLYLRAKARDPHIGLATVYRSLALLKEAGLVEEHPLGEDHGHFETIQESPHYHFTCARCGRVIELSAPQVTQKIQELCAQQGLRAGEIHLHIRGVCSGCQGTETNYPHNGERRSPRSAARKEQP